MLHARGVRALAQLARGSSALQASWRATPVVAPEVSNVLSSSRYWSTSKPSGLRLFASKADPSSVLPPVKEGKAGEMPSIFDQATGLERGEIDNPDLFKHNEVMRGPFGTKENPVKIQSAFDSRIVGCTGHSQPNDHDLIWMVVEKGRQSTCPDCGQVFELDQL